MRGRGAEALVVVVDMLAVVGNPGGGGCRVEDGKTLELKSFE